VQVCYDRCHEDSSAQDTVAEPKTEFVQSLFQEQQSPLLKFLVSRFRDIEDAAEIAQETWLRIHRLENPEHLKNPRAFLFQTASNIAIDRSRHAAVAKKYLEQSISLNYREECPTVENSVAADEALQLIKNSLGSLPHKCRDAFLLHRGRDMSYSEIAVQLGVSTSMVEKYIIRTLKHLRHAINKEANEIDN
jgi:RNA polymerase sigma factor (sigma-70 family)